MPTRTITVKEHWRRRPHKKTLAERGADNQRRRRPRKKRVGLRQ